jgi:hypothetical protein
MVYATQRFGMVSDLEFCQSLLVARWMQGVQKAGNRQPIRAIAFRFKGQSQRSRTEKLMRTSRWIASIWPISNITRDHLWVTRKSWKNKRIEYSWERYSQRRRLRLLGSCQMGRRMIWRVRTIDSELGWNHVIPGPWLIACFRERLHSDERIRTHSVWCGRWFDIPPWTHRILLSEMMAIQQDAVARHLTCQDLTTAYNYYGRVVSVIWISHQILKLYIIAT